MPDEVSYSDALRLDGQAFVVLGAGGGGIGRQTAVALTQVGAKVLCVDAIAAEAEDIAKQVNGFACVADVTTRAGMKRVFDEANARFGKGLKGVVDVIGVATLAPLTDFDDDKLERQFDIVLRHAILAIQIGAPLLQANGGGSMTFIGSISGVSSVPNQSLYGTAKAALHHLIRTAAHEFGPTGIRVNGVAPGFVRTTRLMEIVPEESWNRIAEMNPLRRAAEPADIARAVLFLCSDLARYVTGNVLTLDGGVHFLASLPQYQRA